MAVGGRREWRGGGQIVIGEAAVVFLVREERRTGRVEGVLSVWRCSYGTGAAGTAFVLLTWRLVSMILLVRNVVGRSAVLLWWKLWVCGGRVP